MRPLPFVRHSLGAEELIELGRVNAVPNGNQPFLSPRIPRGVALGQAAPEADMGGFVGETLAKDLDILGKIVLVPMDVMAKSEAVTYRTIGDLLNHVPSTDVLLGRVLLLGNAANQLSLPTRPGLDNLLGGIARALDATGSGAQNQRALDDAQAAILAQASDQAQIKQILDATGVTGDDLSPESGALAATPPPAAMQGASSGGQQRPESVLLMFTKG